jgi:hypothetical protein
MLALLVGLVFALLFAGRAEHPTVVMKPPPAPFTVDGRRPAVRAGAVTLHRGDVVRFTAPVRVIHVNRLECPGDLHRIALRDSTWNVPDLPSGLYGVEGAAGDQLVRVQSHDAPCP